MKVVLVNHSDSLGGASVVTFRLMQALRESGIDARMLVSSKSTNCEYVEVAAPYWRTRLPFMAEHLTIFTRNGFSRSDLFKASIASVGLPLSRHKLIREADVIVLNWVNQGMLSLNEIERIAAEKPVVWTMHDMWNLTGICHHAGKCERYYKHCHSCPLLHCCSGEHDLSAKTFDRKARLYKNGRISFVAVSQWLAECAQHSALLAKQQVEIIHSPFPIEEINTAAPFDRQKLGLPAEGRIILMCAARLDDPVKDLPAAIEALNTLCDSDAVAVFVGEIRNPHALDSLRLPHHHLGPVYDKHRLYSIFAHSQVVLSSSIYESFGATLLEAQAAGATPVGYVHDGRADIITNGISGYAAGHEQTLADALSLALRQPIAREQLHQAAMRYSNATIAKKYIDLFNKRIQK